MIQWKPLNVIISNDQIATHYTSITFAIGKSFFVIIQLMFSVYLGSKVIILRGFHCTVYNKDNKHTKVQ